MTIRAEYDGYNNKFINVETHTPLYDGQHYQLVDVQRLYKVSRLVGLEGELEKILSIEQNEPIVIDQTELKL
ncbi:MAG: hypothetical protein WC444_06935 [Candidatus Paceibacterota bacterium]